MTPYLARPGVFFDRLRDGLLGPKLSDDEVRGLTSILGICVGLPLSFAAYALATAFHETAGTMLPIRERGGSAYFFKMYDPKGSRPLLARANGNIHPGDGCRFSGRGYVQLTWRCNYENAGEQLNVDLVGNPDRAMEPALAAAIMRRGMIEGWFTGKAFRHYLPAGRATFDQFVKARRIINSNDRASKIAAYAVEFQDALIEGGWA